MSNSSGFVLFYNHFTNNSFPDEFDKNSLLDFKFADQLIA